MTNTANRSASSTFEALNATRTAVAVFDVSDRTQIEVTGADRTRFLHSFLSNDIKRLKPGQGCEAFVTSLKGKVVAHVFVFCTEGSLWLDGTPGQREAIVKHLGKYLLIDDVQLNSRNEERGELFVTGPLSAQLLQLEGTLSDYGNISRESDERSFDIRRVDLFGQPGFFLSVPTERVEFMKLSLCGLGVAEGSPELFEFLRIEAGFPQFGVDVTDDNLAQEVARTKQCISFDKGCYLGQETIARLDSLGHTNRELRRLRFETPVVPVAGTLIFDESGATDVGVITSAALDMGGSEQESSKNAVALGMLKRVACKPDMPVAWKCDGVEIVGRVR